MLQQVGAHQFHDQGDAARSTRAYATKVLHRQRGRQPNRTLARVL